MNQMESAFAKVGLPSASVAFAAACHDAARMALNLALDDPKRAAAAWLSIAGGLAFRGALEQFLAAVAEERRERKSDGGAGIVLPQGQRRGAPLSETDAGEATGAVPQGHLSAAEPATASEGEAIGEMPQGQRARVSPSVLDATAGATILVPQGQTSIAPAVAPKPPAASTVRGIVHAKEVSARVMSGIRITDRGGRLIELDTLPVSGLEYRLRAQGRRAAKGAVDYNMLFLVKQQVERQAFVPPRAIVGDVLDVTELRHLHDMAKAFASSPMVQLPESLRQEALAA